MTNVVAYWPPPGRLKSGHGGYFGMKIVPLFYNSGDEDILNAGFVLWR